MFFIRSQKDFKLISFDLLSNHLLASFHHCFFFLVFTASREVPTSLYYSLTKQVFFVFLKIRKHRFRLFCSVFVCLFVCFIYLEALSSCNSLNPFWKKRETQQNNNGLNLGVTYLDEI